MTREEFVSKWSTRVRVLRDYRDPDYRNMGIGEHEANLSADLIEAILEDFEEVS